MTTENRCRKGEKIKGFFGMFDILGYRNLIKNDLNDVINIFDSLICKRHLLALALADSHTTNLQPSVQPKPLAFSDTFIFYQQYYSHESSFAKLQRASAFIISSCYLLRLAFEGGIPLRGAISFGEYFIDTDNMVFFGTPAVEAHDAGISQDWSGAILCDSAWNFINPMLEDANLKNHVLQIKSNDECKNCDRTCPFDLTEFLVEYEIPYKNLALKGIALRWDDFAVRDLFAIPLDNININSKLGYIDDYQGICRTIQDRFGAHNKNTGKDDVIKKIENTSKFMETINNIYSKEFTMRKFHNSYIPYKIRLD